MAKSQDFNLQRCTTSQPRSDANNCREKRCNHESGRLTRALVKINHFKLNENIGRDRRLRLLRWQGRVLPEWRAKPELDHTKPAKVATF